jgi:ribosomal protein L11 methylase PrmA
MEALLDNLEGCVRGLKSPASKTEWSDYYAETNYTPESAEHKKSLIAEFLENLHPQTVWDLGGNVGLYSRVAAQKGADVICLDSDHLAVHLNYEECRKSGTQNVLPLVMDLTNPSTGMGWAGTERKSLEERGPADCVMALALVHHLAISNNVPLALLADYFSRLGKALIVEFIPKEDTQVKRLLSSRKDIFPNYAVHGFEEAFKTRFVLKRRDSITGSLRTLYLMERL